ncbi:pirin family protein [Mycolicibacter longobardus]|uniref:Quercetin 2,3-dioxygenase n=1 Tax=Mycolicibacter longobardus TaxID=1108812 RepID=A0A1X1Y5R5_9MYCO|nr:pirin-like bicupin family protein [Mycolicibacter longobardus]MCV7382950.1 pirin family protein [Mycolicibacter longobardus]ORW06473.1 quercetin 2,3-dioxygenase [Mycolicibacter longobardus]
MPAAPVEPDVRRAADRAVTTTPWLNSRHSFSFNDYYDPGNTHHGLLLVNNDDIVAPSAGFATHPHRDAEIVTWVLSGALSHRDSIGNSGLIHPGLAQRMSAGTGILHSEQNESDSEPVHFVQMWIMPDEPGRAPGYQQQEITEALTGGGLVTVASGSDPGAAITIGNADATLYAARLRPGDSLDLPDAPYTHLFVPLGSVDLEGAGALGPDGSASLDGGEAKLGTPLRPGDAVRFTGGGGQRLTAATPSEVLVWAMKKRLGD